MSKSPSFWILKNEVSDYSIDDLKADKKTLWVGVRNYQARNFMRDSMKEGDLCFFYHSNAEPSGAAGIMRVSKAAQPDLTALDKKSVYYDAKATKENPIWFCPEVEFVEKMKRLVSIGEMRDEPSLKNLMILQKGSRLSVTPVDQKDFEKIVKMSGKK